MCNIILCTWVHVLVELSKSHALVYFSSCFETVSCGPETHSAWAGWPASLRNLSAALGLEAHVTTPSFLVWGFDVESEDPHVCPASKHFTNGGISPALCGRDDHPFVLVEDSIAPGCCRLIKAEQGLNSGGLTAKPMHVPL